MCLSFREGEKGKESICVSRKGDRGKHVLKGKRELEDQVKRLKSVIITCVGGRRGYERCRSGRRGKEECRFV